MSAKLKKKIKYATSYIKTKTNLILIFSIVILILLFYFFVYPIFFRSYADIPKLPELKNQPEVLVNYIQKINKDALENSSSDKAVGELAMTYHANFFYDRAKTCYKQAIKLNSKEWKWEYYLAIINEELGNNIAAINEFKKVLNINQKISQAWFKLGNAYLKNNSIDNAITAFNKVLELENLKQTNNEFISLNKGAFPLKAYAKLELARAKFTNGELNSAKELLENLINDHPAFGAAYRLLGNVYSKLGNNNKSMELETRAGDFENFLSPADPIYDELILFSRNTKFIINQIEIASQSENYDWAIYLIKHILSYDPYNGEAITRELKLYLDTQHLEKAKLLLPLYYEIYKSDEVRLLDMAKYLAFRGQYEQAVNLLKRVIKLNPNSTEAHVEFINILSEFKQYNTAIEYCNEVLKTNPDNLDIRNKLAEIFIKNGQIEKANQQIKIMQKLNPNSEINFILLAKISRAENRTTNSIFYYEKSIKTNPNNINMKLEFGQYLLDLHKYSTALNHYKNSLKTFPNNINLIERYAWILAVCPIKEIRNGKEALELAKRLILMKKFTREQEVRCGVTLTAAYSATKQFKLAIESAEKFIDEAIKSKQNNYVLKLQEILKLAKLNESYHLSN